MNISMICRRFFEDADNMLISRDILQSNNSTMIIVPNKVHMNLNVPNALIINKISINIDDTMVFTPKGTKLNLKETKLYEKLKNP